MQRNGRGSGSDQAAPEISTPWHRGEHAKRWCCVICATARDAAKRLDSTPTGHIARVRNAGKTCQEAIQSLSRARYSKEWPAARFLRDVKLYDGSL